MPASNITMLLRSVPSGLLRLAFIPLLPILSPIRSVLCAAESDQMTAWAESAALFTVRFVVLEDDAVMPDQHIGARPAGAITLESSTCLENKPARKHSGLVA